MSLLTPTPTATPTDAYHEPSLSTSSIVRVLFWTALPFTLVAVALSAVGIWKHLTRFVVPAQQRYVVRILFMVPMYVIVAQCGIGFPWAARYLELFRDCYEALVIYAFFTLLVEYIGGEGEVPRVFNARRLPMPGGETELLDPSRGNNGGSDEDDEPIRLGTSEPAHPKKSTWVVTLGRFLFFWRPERAEEDPVELFMSIKRGILQFVVVMPWISVVTIILDIFHLFDEGDFSPHQSYLWLSVGHIISATVSIVYLVRFYNIASIELKPHRPLPKFLCIKSVVFLSFYQNFMLAIVFATIDASSVDYTASTIQNFMIAIEMCFAAIAHLFYFSASEYKDPLAMQSHMELADDHLDNEDNAAGSFAQAHRHRHSRSNSAATGIRVTVAQAILSSFLCVDLFKDTMRTFGPRGQLVEPLIETNNLQEDDTVVWKDDSYPSKPTQTESSSSHTGAGADDLADDIDV